MDVVAEWLAPAATMLAAMMTAANLGARVTGWGFVVFTAGSICWSIIGFSTGQTNLLAANSFLTLINAVGIWRWLGQQRAYEDGGKSAARASRRIESPTLFTATGIAGVVVVDRTGEEVGKVVEALVQCETGEVSYIVISTGGVGGIDEKLRAVGREHVQFGCDQFELRLSNTAFKSLPLLNDGHWPARI